MRRIVYLLLIAGAAWLGYHYYQSRQVWEPYTSSQGGFKAEFPEQPQEERQSLKTRDGEVELHVVHARRGSREYAVAYRDYSGDWAEVPAERRVQALSIGMLGSGVRVQGSGLIHSNGLEGVEIRYQMPNSTDTITAHVFVRGGRMYMVMVGTPAFDLWPEDSDRFFDSFKVE